MNTELPVKPRREWLSDLWRITLVMLIAGGVRTWIIAHTEVISRDGIGFIRYALQLEEPPTNSFFSADRPMTRAEVLKSSFHPPGYAVSILVTSWPVRAIMGETSADSMVLSAQIASLLASLFLVVPMYFLGKLVFDRQTAFIATLLFQVLPVTTQVASDGLSDNLFLCCIATSTWLTAIAFRRESVRWFGLAGFATGVTYLVRPEGLILLIAAAVVAIGCKVRREISWGKLFSRGVLMGAGAAVVMVPYIVTIERFTNKPTGIQLFHWIGGGEKMGPSWIHQAEHSSRPNAVNFPIADWFQDFGQGKKPDMKWAAEALGKELFKASFYVMPFLAMIGFGVLWPRLRRDPAAMLIVTLGTCHSLLLLVIAKGAGYVAERHTLLIVMCGSYFAAGSLPILGEKIALIPRLGRWRSSSFWSAGIAVVLVASCLPIDLKPLHRSRAGHRSAGHWIATQKAPDSYVIDPFSWAEFFAGNVRLPSNCGDNTKTVFAICENGTNQHPRLHFMHFARYFADQGKIVYHWPENEPVEKGKVFVYRWDGDCFPHAWQQAFEALERKKVE